MLKVLVGALFVLSTSAAQAANWTRVVDSVNGVRLLIDKDSIKFSNYTKENGDVGHRVAGVVQFVKEGSNPYTIVIDTDECLTNSNGVLISLYGDGINTTDFWTLDGDKVYDAEGQFLCGWTIGTLQKLKKQNGAKSTEQAPTL
jgi:hypothetical protein